MLCKQNYILRVYRWTITWKLGHRLIVDQIRYFKYYKKIDHKKSWTNQVKIFLIRD